MPVVKRFDHVGITVTDLDAAVAFFGLLGFDEEGRASMQGEFVDTVIGIVDSLSEIVVLQVPEQDFRLELSCFQKPERQPAAASVPTATAPGLRNLTFEVEDLDATLAPLAQAGYGLVGGVGEYENAWRMAYVNGPDGIIISLAQRLS